LKFFSTYVENRGILPSRARISCTSDNQVGTDHNMIALQPPFKEHNDDLRYYGMTSNNTTKQSKIPDTSTSAGVNSEGTDSLALAGSSKQVLHSNIAGTPLSDKSNSVVRVPASQSMSKPYNNSKMSPSAILYSSESTFPLSNRRHAILFCHYVDNLSHWLDVTSRMEHFSKELPARAAHCDLLFYAILTLSSRHLSRINFQNTYEAEEYHERCLNILIPIFNNEEAIADENILATAVLLRLYEEMTASVAGSDEEKHLKGINVYVNAVNACLDFKEKGDVGRTAFWAYLRQDLYITMLYAHPLKLRPELYPLDYIHETSDDDCIWANQAICIVANVANFCYNTVNRTQSSMWEYLDAQIERWHMKLPSRFRPILYGQQAAFENRFYPEIRFQQIWHGCKFC